MIWLEPFENPQKYIFLIISVRNNQQGLMDVGKNLNFKNKNML